MSSHGVETLCSFWAQNEQSGAVEKAERQEVNGKIKLVAAWQMLLLSGNYIIWKEVDCLKL